MRAHGRSFLLWKWGQNHYNAASPMLWADCALLLHEIGVAPIAHGLQHGNDGSAEIGKPVLYFGRYHRIYRADNQTVAVTDDIDSINLSPLVSYLMVIFDGH